MSEKTKIQFIIIHESVLKSWMRDASTFALFASLIGLGVVLDSGVMQWCGFFVGVIVLLAKSSNTAKRMTREQAIKHLQDLSASE